MIGVDDRVVCVNDRFDAVAHFLFNKLPQKGKIYVVRSIEANGCQQIGITLVGIKGVRNPTVRREQAFHIERFRKLSTDPGKKKQAAVCSE